MSYFATVYNFGEAYHDADWNFKVPGSVFWRMYLVTSGEAWVRIYGRKQRLTPGHLYLIPAYEPHENILEGKFVHSYLHFIINDPTVVAMLERYRMAFEVAATKLAEDLFVQFGEIFRGFELETSVPQVYEKNTNYIYWDHRYKSLPESARLVAEGGISMLMGLFVGGSHEEVAHIHPAVTRGKLYIDTHYGEPLQIEEVASESGMRHETFSRLFRRHLGKTPHEYLMRRRVNAAKALLQLSNKSVKQIAVECGFGDPSYFCLIFRRLENMTPGQFRKLNF